MTSRSLLIVGNFLSGTGTKRTYCEDLADRFDRNGWETIRTSAAPGRFGRLFDMTRTTWARRHDYEVAHIDVFSGAAFVWAEAVCFELRRLKKPYVLTLRGGNLPLFARRWPRRVGALLRSAGRVTAPSAYLRSELKLFAKDIIVLPNAIDIGRYPFRLRSVTRPRLVWLRAFHKIYNPELAVEVLAELTDPSATLTMIGADKCDGSLQATEQRAKALGVADRVTLVPGIPKSDVAAAIAANDIFLNTTNFDNTPVSVLEAMGCGLCVISTNVGGLPYLLRDGHDALLVPPKDRAAMARAVNRVLGERDLSASLSANARAHAERCDWNEVMAQWKSVMHAVISA